jgi:competence protein ComEA
MGLIAWQAWTARRGACLPTVLDEDSTPQLRLDLNSANRAALRQLPGVGEGLAARIETYRREHGPFRTIDDLRHVPGIGPKMLERLRPLLEVSAATWDDAPLPALDRPPKEPGAPRPAGKKTPPTERIDVNTAAVEQLQRLPGVGPGLAQRIVEYRAERPFRSVDDLRRVRGIGAKTLERLRPHVVVAGPPAPADR